MKKLATGIVVVLAVFIQSMSSSAEEKEIVDGKTTVTGSVKVTKQVINYDIDIMVKIRQSGTSGTGNGVVEVVLLDKDFRPAARYFTKKKLEAAPSGSAEGQYSKQIIGASTDKFFGLVWAIKASDKIDFPRDIDDFEKFLKDQFAAEVDLTDAMNALGKGESKSYGNFSLMRLP